MNAIFFDDFYPCFPFVHHAKLNPHTFSTLDEQPPLCLRYIVWCHASTRSAKYKDRVASYYRSARMHLEHDEMQEDGFGITSVAHVQALALIGIYEIEHATPTKAFMSSRRAISLASILGLHHRSSQEINISGMPTVLPEPKDFIDAEERRRTFWYLYYSDRWICAGSGRPSSINDDDITTLMPASEEAYQHGFVEQTQTLQEALRDGLGPTAPPLAAAIVSGWLLTHVTAHLRQVKVPGAKEQEDQLWLSHQHLQNKISQMLMTLPARLRAANTRDPLAFFINMCLHEFKISLNQTAITLAQSTSSKLETVTKLRAQARRAAEEIVDIMRTSANIEIRTMNPFTPSALYMASTVYINDLNQGYEVENARQAILFILFTIKLFRRHYKVAQIWVAQLLHNLKDCNIALEYTLADATPLKCWAKIGDDFDAMGPLFSTEALLDTKQSTKQEVTGETMPS